MPDIEELKEQLRQGHIDANKAMAYAFKERVADSAWVMEARKSLPYFTQEVLVDAKGDPLKFIPMHYQICEAANNDLNQQLILAPRGHGKSTLISVANSIWRAGNNHNIRIIIVSDTIAVAKAFLRQIESVMASVKYKTVFGNLIPPPRSTTWTDVEMIIKREGAGLKDATFLALGAGSAILGRRADLIICDDIVSKENSATEYQRKQLSEWFRKALLPVLAPDGKIVVIGTRFHEEDLFAELIEKGWPCLKLKAIDDDGNPYWSDYFTKEVLEDRKRTMGSIDFAGQFLNEITSFKGNYLLGEWLHYYDAKDALPDDLSYFAGVDLSRLSEKGDYMTIATIGVTNKVPKRGYLVDLVHVRSMPGEQINLITESYKKWNHHAIFAENVAAQDILVQLMQKQTLMPIVGSKVTQDKGTRFRGMAISFENGQILIPGYRENGEWKPSPIIQPFVEEWLGYPLGSHDDCLDGVYHAVRAAQLGGPPAAIGKPEKEKEIKTYKAPPRPRVRLFH